MFYAAQIVHNVHTNKPERCDRPKGPTYESEFFGTMPAYVQRHYVYPGQLDEYGRGVIALPKTLKEARAMLRSGEIGVAMMPQTHNECCGNWKTNPHASWCPIQGKPAWKYGLSTYPKQRRYAVGIKV